MKKITLKFIKGLLVIVLFTGVSVVSSATGVQTVSEANAQVIGVPQQGAALQSSTQRLTAVKVNQYLIEKGYDVYSVAPIKGTGKFKAIVANANGTVTLIIDSGVINAGSNSILAGSDSPL